MTYLEKELEYCIRQKIYSYHGFFTVGRLVIVKTGLHSGISGVVQNVTHDKSKPLQDNKVRVWLDGFTCTDIFDYNKDDLNLQPYKY